MILGLNSPTQGFTDRAFDTAVNLSADCMLWLASAGPQDAVRYPSELNIVRLDNWYDGENPQDYARAVAPTIDRWWSTPNVVYQMGNEPDLESGHNGEQFGLYASAVRAAHPGIRVCNPPLRAENTHLWDCQTLMQGDFISVHCYWQVNHDADIDNPNLGGAWGHVIDCGRPVIVTEVNAVPASGSATDTAVNWDDRNNQVAEWCALADQGGVYAACLFIADAAPDWAGFDVGPEAATAIRDDYDLYMDHDDGTDDGDEGGQIMVNASAVIQMAQTQVGHPYSGTYDALNGNHPWAYWCQSLVEATHRNLGLTVTPQSSAVVAAGAHDLQPGRAPAGAAIWFGTSFYFPDGHTAISMGDGTCIGTLTDGSGIGYRTWNETTTGYLGWAYYDGVVADEDIIPTPDPPPASFYVQPDNPYSPDANGNEVGIGGGFMRYYQSVAAGIDPMVVTGFAMANEHDATVTDDDGTARQRTIQRFQRLTLIYQPETPFPYDVVAALATQTIVEV